MKLWIVGLTASLFSINAMSAQRLADALAPAGAPAGAVAIPLYGKANPGSLVDEMQTGSGNDVRNVTYPTLTPVLPRPGTANGAAVIVAPGGGFMFLSMDNEGWRVAQALADQGITAFVLKYRLDKTPKDDAAYRAGVLKLVMDVAAGKPRPPFDTSNAVADALAALKLVRSSSTEWGIDPKRVGMVGFSAGAITTLKAVLDAAENADPATAPPDFFGYIYGPMEAVEVPQSAPPMFAALALDDGMFSKGDFGLVTAWRDAKRPVEFHLYQNGGHGFGLGKSGATNSLWMTEFVTWIEMQGFLKETKKR